MVWSLVLLGYLIGAFPTAYVLGRKLKGIDIRNTGDGNMGARNAYFILGHSTGILIGFLDALKGLFAVLLTKLLGAPEYIVLITGVAAVLGHNFPVFLGFKGGRGEATTIGVLLVVMPPQMLIIGPITILSLILFKNSILTAAVLYVGLAVAALWMDVKLYIIIYELGLAILVALTHLGRVVFVRKPTSPAQ